MDKSARRADDGKFVRRTGVRLKEKAGGLPVHHRAVDEESTGGTSGRRFGEKDSFLAEW